MVRSLLFYFVVAAACAAAAVYIYRLPPGGFGWVSLVVVVILSTLAWWQVWQFGRDLQSQHSETEGPLVKKWQRAELFVVWQSHFMLVGRNIFKIEAEEWVYLREDEHLRVRHFPRTMTVISIEKSGNPESSS